MGLYLGGLYRDHSCVSILMGLYTGGGGLSSKFYVTYLIFHDIKEYMKFIKEWKLNQMRRYKAWEKLKQKYFYG